MQRKREREAERAREREREREIERERGRQREIRKYIILKRNRDTGKKERIKRQKRQRENHEGVKVKKKCQREREHILSFHVVIPVALKFILSLSSPLDVRPSNDTPLIPSKECRNFPKERRKKIVFTSCITFMRKKKQRKKEN